MDDSKIDQIAREVMVSLRKSRSAATAESAPPVRSVARSVEADDPSLRLLSVPGGVVGSPCVIEPDKICVGSLRCRSYGH